MADRWQANRFGREPARMSIYGLALFLHVAGAVFTFIGLATLIFGVAALRLAVTVDQVRAVVRPMVLGRRIGLEHISVIDVVTMAGVVLTAATGLYMASKWGFSRGWIKAAIVSFALMAPIGPLVINPRLHAIAATAEAAAPGLVGAPLFARTRDPVLSVALLTLIAWLLGIVFLMTTKPSLAMSAVAMTSALLIGLATGWSLRAGKDQGSPGRREI